MPVGVCHLLFSCQNQEPCRGTYSIASEMDEFFKFSVTALFLTVISTFFSMSCLFYLYARSFFLVRCLFVFFVGLWSVSH